jgi:hypothetical protein
MKKLHQTEKYYLVFIGVLLLTAAFSVSGKAAVWVSGSSTYNKPGVYGTKGVPFGTNMPGARQEGVSWIDTSDRLWLFGGWGYDINGVDGALNDLWKLDGTYWIWVSGSDTVNQSGVYGTKGTPSLSNVPGARYDSVSWIDESGRMWLFGGANDNGDLFNDLWKYDGTFWTWMSGASVVDQNGVYGTKGVPASTNVPGSRWGSISWIDANGRFWLFGGYGRDSIGSTGNLNDLWKYDGTYWTWVSGSNTINQAGVYGTKGVAASNNVPGAREKSISWIDESGNLWLFGGRIVHLGIGIDFLNDLWKFDDANWTWVSGSNDVNQPGSYGTKGIPSGTNVPGARGWSISWIDSSGNFWLFGGSGYDSSGTLGKLNDLWEYDGTNWTWANGSNLSGQPGVYGTKGVFAATNIPGGRDSSFSWIDSSNNLWLFGGYSTEGATQKTYNDLWKFLACQVLGDVNADCKVDFKDFAILADHWLEQGYPR